MLCLPRKRTYGEGLCLLLFGFAACGNAGPTKLLTATAISVGITTGCAALQDGEVLCWGGNSTPRDVSVARNVEDDLLAKQVDGVAGAVDVTVGDDSACALLAGGVVRCWGAADPGITSATAVSSGYSHACALLADGTVQCWGDNLYGELGIGSAAGGAGAVTGITDATGVSAGYDTSCATLADGTVQCWGTNGYGQLGDGTTTDSAVPVVVSGLTNAAAACAGEDHSCARLTDGTVQCWGANSFGQLGDGTRIDSAAPVAVTGIGNATAIACGSEHTCALLHDGSIDCWGADGGGFDEGFGALGNPGATQDCQWVTAADPSVTVETGCAPTPTPVAGITDAVAIAAGDYSSCVVLADGSAKCWGYNLYGQLGDGTTWSNPSPVTVMVQPRE